MSSEGLNMKSVQLRKLGKHLFIFEKEKPRGPNEKSNKGRTLITLCATDEKLPTEFVKYMRSLFDILDEYKSGFVKLSDIEAYWSHKNGCSSSTSGVIEQLRKVTPPNGLLSFETLCVGFSQALHSSEGSSGSVEPGYLIENNTRSDGFPGVKNWVENDSSIPDGFTDGRKSCKIGENADLKTETGATLAQTASGVRSRQISSLGREEETGASFGSALRIGNKIQENAFVKPDFESEFGPDARSKSFETDTEYLDQQHERGRRPKSMFSCSERTRSTDLLVARKKGGILEGIQRTDKEAVIDKLKQWRNDKLRKKCNDPDSNTSTNVRKSSNSGLNGVLITRKPTKADMNGVTRQFERMTHGYQSDNERGYRRQRRFAASTRLTGNETDCESYRSSTRPPVRHPTERFGRTTVYYQGQIAGSRAERNGSSSKITVYERPESSEKRETSESGKDAISSDSELQMLKKGLRTVDRCRDCLVKRIADIQELNLYKRLNPDSQDTKSSDHRKHVRFNSFHLQSLSNHLEGLKIVLDQVKSSEISR